MPHDAGLRDIDDLDLRDVEGVALERAAGEGVGARMQVYVIQTHGTRHELHQEQRASLGCLGGRRVALRVCGEL